MRQVALNVALNGRPPPSSLGSFHNFGATTGNLCQFWLLWSTSDIFPCDMGPSGLNEEKEMGCWQLYGSSMVLHYNWRRQRPILSLISHFYLCMTVGQVWKVCISSDEQWVVSSIFPDTIQVWSLKTGEPVLSIPGSYTDVAITHDSSRIVAVSGHDLVVSTFKTDTF